MGFQNPSSPVVGLVAGTTVTTGAGSVTTTGAASVTTNTQAQQSAIDLAVIQGLLPAGVNYGIAAARLSASTGQSGAQNVTMMLLPQNSLVQYVLKLLVFSANVAGVQQINCREMSAAGAFVQYITLAFHDGSKSALLVPFGAGLALTKGSSLQTINPPGVGFYECQVIYDYLIFPS